MKLSQQEIAELIAREKEKAKLPQIHLPYTERSGRVPDFKVEYGFFSELNLKFGQGARCDFLYEGEDPKTDGIHMIVPEFLDCQGRVILDKTIRPNSQGEALMWILSGQSRIDFHIPKIRIGTRGYWMLGSKKIAIVTVTEILGLYENSE